MGIHPARRTVPLRRAAPQPEPHPSQSSTHTPPPCKPPNLSQHTRLLVSLARFQMQGFAHSWPLRHCPRGCSGSRPGLFNLAPCLPTWQARHTFGRDAGQRVAERLSSTSRVPGRQLLSWPWLHNCMPAAPHHAAACSHQPKTGTSQKAGPLLFCICLLWSRCQPGVPEGTLQASLALHPLQSSTASRELPVFILQSKTSGLLSASARLLFHVSL